MGFGIFLAAYSSSHGSSNKTDRHPPLGRLAASSGSLFTRSLKLFALGLFLGNSADWSHWRIPGLFDERGCERLLALLRHQSLTSYAPSVPAGVLQALSVAFFIVGTMNAVVPPPVHTTSETLQRWTRFLLTHAVLGWLPLVALNLSVTFFLPVPGCPTGYLGPGGAADSGQYSNCTGGAHLYVDTLVFGRRHLYQTPTCQAAFQTGAYDPEGALNWLMVAATTYVGYFSAVLVIVFAGSVQQKARALVATGSLLAALSVVSGGVLVTSTPWVPLNKNLWSVSYVLLSSAAACCVYALLLVVVDSNSPRVWTGWPLLSVGKNSIFVYFMVRTRRSIRTLERWSRLPLSSHSLVYCGWCLRQHEVFESWAPFSPRAVHANDMLSHWTLLLFNAVGVLWSVRSGHS